jgi:hypothetical protein
MSTEPEAVCDRARDLRRTHRYSSVRTQGAADRAVTTVVHRFSRPRSRVRNRYGAIIVDMAIYQYMTQEDEVWTTVEAAAYERDADLITLIDLREADGHVVDRYSVLIYDVVELAEAFP